MSRFLYHNLPTAPIMTFCIFFFFFTKSYLFISHRSAGMNYNTIIIWNVRLQIIFHGTDRASLHKHLYPECLPECYGGTLDVPTITGSQWHELLLLVEKEFYGTFIQFTGTSPKPFYTFYNPYDTDFVFVFFLLRLSIEKFNFYSYLWYNVRK